MDQEENQDHLSRKIGMALVELIGDKYGMVDLIGYAEFFTFSTSHVVCQVNPGEITCTATLHKGITYHSVDICDPNWVSEVNDFIMNAATARSLRLDHIRVLVMVP